MLELKPMNQDMYNNYIKNSIRLYAEEIAKSRGIDFDKALQLTNEEFNTLLPEGLKSQNQFLNVIINDKNRDCSNPGTINIILVIDIKINPANI